MASYGGGRGVNVSQYLRDLRVVPESAVEETLVTDEDLAKDLALFTNTQFYDFETGQHTDYQAPPAKPEVTQSPSEDVPSTDPVINFDFVAGDFSFGDFSSTYTSPTIPTFPDALGNLQPIQPNPQTTYPVPPVSQHHHQPPQAGYVPPAAAPTTNPRIGGVVAGEKRKATEPPVISPPNGRVLSFEEASRLAAEEDKRRRNTAASARFRIKKKQREQALEKSAKEMTEKVTLLESRISALETENKWLKSLVTEKHGGRDDILEKLLKEFAAKETAANNKKSSANGGGGAEVKDSINAAASSAASSSSGDESSKRD